MVKESQNKKKGEENKKKMSSLPPVYLTVWNEAWLALTQPRQYIRWAFQPLSRSIAYIAILNILLSLITTSYVFIVVKPQVFAFSEWARDEVPTISLADGKLSIEGEKTFGFSDSDRFYFKIDTTQSQEDEPFIDNFYEAGLLITSDQILLADNGSTEADFFSDLGVPDFSFDGEALADKLESFFTLITIFILPLVFFLYHMVAKLFFSFFFATILMITTGFKHDLLRLWSMAIYALTPAILAGYVSLIFYPILGFYTLVFLSYYFWAYLAFTRFLSLKTKHTK